MLTLKITKQSELPTLPTINPFEDPLIKAIDTNNLEALRSLLKSGHKPDLRNAFLGFGDNTTDPKILDLLVEYNALPEGVTLSTLKLILFSRGNRRILISEFWNEPDLNLNYIPGLQSPMIGFARRGNVKFVLELIQKGVAERPIGYLFLGVHPSYFRGCDLLKLNDFKDGITRTLNSSDIALAKQCEVAELLISNPTSDLDTFLYDEQHSHYSMGKFLPFFAWVARNNKVNLLGLEHFKKLFQKDKSLANEAAVIAAAFGSKEFLIKAIEEKLIGDEGAQKACSVAAANGDTELLAALMDLSKNPLSQEISQTTRKQSGIYYIENFNTALFWAVRNNHYLTVAFLLEAGQSPNAYKDDFCDDSYLKLSIRCFTDSNIMKALISHGANIDHQDTLKNTALHEAACKNNFEALKILIESGASAELVNNSEKRPLELITDETVRKQINELIRKKAALEKEVGDNISTPHVIQNQKLLPVVINQELPQRVQAEPVLFLAKRKRKTEVERLGIPSVPLNSIMCGKYQLRCSVRICVGIRRTS